MRVFVALALLAILATPVVAEQTPSTQPTVTEGTELGQAAPDFTLPTSAGGTYTLSARGDEPVVLVFFRGTW